MPRNPKGWKIFGGSRGADAPGRTSVIQELTPEVQVWGVANPRCLQRGSRPKRTPHPTGMGEKNSWGLMIGRERTKVAAKVEVCKEKSKTPPSQMTFYNTNCTVGMISSTLEGNEGGGGKKGSNKSATN